MAAAKTVVVAVVAAKWSATHRSLSLAEVHWLSRLVLVERHPVRATGTQQVVRVGHLCSIPCLRSVAVAVELAVAIQAQTMDDPVGQAVAVAVTTQRVVSDQVAVTAETALNLAVIQRVVVAEVPAEPAAQTVHTAREAQADQVSRATSAER